MLMKERLRLICEVFHGLLGADKGYISPSLTSYYDAQGVDLQTPLRANMKEDRPKPVVRRLMKARIWLDDIDLI